MNYSFDDVCSFVGARPPSTAAADNKKKAIINDDCMIGPVDIFGTDTQAKPKSLSDNGGQPKSEVVPLGNGPSTKPLTKEKPQNLTSDVYEPPAMNIPVAPEPKPKPVESVERKGGEPKEIMPGAQLDPGVKKPPKPPGTTVPKSSSPKKRGPTTVPMVPSPQGARESPKGVLSTAGSASKSQNDALSGNGRNGALETTTRATKVPSVPPSTTSPTNSRYKSNGQPQQELSTPKITSPTRPVIMTKRHNPPTSPMQYTSTSQANQHDSSSITSPARLESECSSLSTTSDRVTRTARPPSPTTGRLSSPTKARSVEEATKVAIAAAKVPHPPNAKDPKEIINATEKALRPPSLSAPRK
ncbi:hypothetical protein ANCCAN_21712 [Ancylostoma caninum]|uniref:Uncharacterized protein n=1 Tax=Ancylostoma caninum TaxID=29170 RepID=A0A368FJR8_ANCCA|nr:hypothetical protein ANCCAN_21712 [Ancylostoma caninum]